MSTTEQILKFVLMGDDQTGTAFSGVAGKVEGVIKQLGQMKSPADAAKLAIGGIATAVGTGAVANFAKSAVSNFEDTAKAAKTLSRQTGMSVDDASRLSYALQRTGVDSAASGTALKTFSKNLSGNSDAFKSLGVATKDAQGNTLSMNQILEATADKFKSMPDGPAKTAEAVALFGKQGTAMIPILNKGSAGIAELEQNSDKYGLTISGPMSASVMKATQNQKDWSDATKGLSVQFGASLLPILTNAAGFVTQHVIPAITSATGLIERHQGAVAVLLPVITGLAGVMGVVASATKIATLAREAHTVATTIGAGASKAFAAGQWLVNAAMSANPIMLVVLAVAALAAGFIAAYQHSQTFRNIVNGAVNDVKQVVESVVNWFKNTAVTDAVTGVKKVTDAVTGVRDWISARITDIKNAGKDVGDFFTKDVPGFFSAGKDKVTGIASDLANGVKNKAQDMANGVVSHVTDMSNNASSGVQNMHDRATNITNSMANGVVGFLSGMGINAGGTVGAMRDDVLRIINALSAGAQDIIRIFRDIFTGNWSDLRSTVGGIASGLKDDVVNAFHNLATGAGNAWNDLKDLASKPVSFVVNTVAAGIVGAYNKIATKFGADAADMPHVDFAAGGVLPGYTPGQDVHSFISPTGMRLNLSGGEAIMRPEFTRAMGSGWVQDMNRLAATRGPSGVQEAMGFAGGGILGTIGSVASSITSKVASTVSNVASAVSDFVKDPEAFLLNAVSGFEDALGGSSFGEMIEAVPKKIVSSIGDWVKKHLSASAAAGSTGNVESWRPTIIAALAANGEPTSDDYVNAWLRQVQTESGGNAAAIQGDIGDVNNASGDLAKGLLQVISATFAAYSLPGHGDIFNGQDNADAAVNYWKHAYNGDISVIGAGHGYAAGTPNALSGVALVGENGPELVYLSGHQRITPNTRALTTTSSPTQQVTKTVEMPVTINEATDPEFLTELLASKMQLAMAGV